MAERASQTGRDRAELACPGEEEEDTSPQAVPGITKIARTAAQASVKSDSALIELSEVAALAGEVVSADAHETQRSAP